jgi:hypothetical protein
MTNDFVALLKDSSLVSVLTVVELTKQTQIFATNLGSWVIPGTLCAAMYLVMSLPLGALARRLEERWKAPTARAPSSDVRDLHLRRGDRRILDGATFSLAHGGVAALMGPSGPARRRFFGRSPGSNVSIRA